MGQKKTLVLPKTKTFRKDWQPDGSSCEWLGELQTLIQVSGKVRNMHNWKVMFLVLQTVSIRTWLQILATYTSNIFEPS